MALSRLLLLCMVASEVWDAETKPVDFVCNKVARRALNIVAETESALSECNDAKTFSTLVQLPCTELHIESWKNKSQGPAVSPALSCVPQSTLSLNTVLLKYNQLISGKLEWFMVDLEDRCTSQ
ncbi:thrombopoietin isoform X3 [Acanthopagrus latus]|uniref:thrombopoietin isoform X3 n=1 Tax=Acanthopagrus latus TaxID=8177 RepID=UPI00187D099E|nr:thrombopoietin isoform X3 [Acanthopagrus latus]